MSVIDGEVKSSSESETGRDPNDGCGCAAKFKGIKVWKDGL